MKKVLILFFAFLLPILIFLFLKMFGKNEFEVPVLFADSVSVPANCGTYAYVSPYVIHDSIQSRINWNKNDTLTIIVFEDGVREKKHERDIHIERIFTEFRDEPVSVVRIYKDQTIADVKKERLTERSVSQDSFTLYRDCVFLLATDQDAAIIDTEKRIRGQYNLVKRDDADRMIMQEMNILLNRY